MVEFLPAAQHSVDHVMRKWPQTIHVFIRYRMACIGCPVAPFHTVATAAAEHGIGLAKFLRELGRAAAFGNKTVRAAHHESGAPQAPRQRS
jgi:hybrid cluster-associated redox disulfide protein